MNSIIKGFIETIDQALTILESIQLDHYKEAAKPLMDYSIGSHFRHILDVFNSIRDGYGTGLVDYDIKRRGHLVERDLELAKEEHKALKKWIISIDEENLNKSVIVKSEVLLSEYKSIEIPGTFARELLFASSHAVHHYALIATALKYKGVVLDNLIGYAPGTASYLRNHGK